MSIFSKILKAGEGRTLKEFEQIVAQVNAAEDGVTGLSDAELAARTVEFRQRLENGEPLDDLTVEAFATVREAAKRVLGQRHFDVQVIGALTLHRGMVAEMKTGEGKTLVSTMPAYLNALTGRGVHIVTVNDYLASRDAEWMGAVHRSLGLNVGLIQNSMTPAERQPAYAADITYGTNNEFGFDYLRDNMAMRPGDRVQRGHAFAIVDEVDSILIDEARTPLIISGRLSDSARWYKDFARIVDRLRPDEHYEVDEAQAPGDHHRGGRESGRGDPRYREPLRPCRSGLRPSPRVGAARQRALPQGRRVPDRLRRGEDRRRVHREGPRRSPIFGGPAPGHRGQRRRQDQRGEPDSRHHHPAELLPPVRKAVGDDRHGRDRGGRAWPRSTGWRSW